MPSKAEVVVVGAGVIGLQAALSLLEAGYGVTIVAKHWPGDFDIEYTSPWAGAHWRTHASASESLLQKFDMETFVYWTDLIKSNTKDEPTGLAFLPAIYYHTYPPPTSESPPWWSTIVYNYTTLPTSSLPENTHSAASYTTICINVPQYLTYLLSRVGSLGVKTITAELYDGIDEVWDLPGISPDLQLAVNCTGLGARDLVGPAEAGRLFPTKGQTIIVRGEAKAARFRDGIAGEGEGEGKSEAAYVIPRPGGRETVLGGSKDVGDWNGDVDPVLAEKILRWCKSLAPELLDPKTGDFEVISHQVGRRPSRVGGPRIELEEVAKGKVVCHSYGHGGAGYQNSVGSAREVVRLVDQYFQYGLGVKPPPLIAFQLP